MKNRKILVPVVLSLLVLAMLLLDVVTATLVGAPEVFNGVGGRKGICEVGVRPGDSWPVPHDLMMNPPERPWLPVIAGVCSTGDGYLVKLVGGLTGITYKQAVVMSSRQASDAMDEVMWRDYYGEPSPYWDPETGTRTGPTPWVVENPPTP